MTDEGHDIWKNMYVRYIHILPRHGGSGDIHIHIQPNDFHWVGSRPMFQVSDLVWNKLATRRLQQSERASGAWPSAAFASERMDWLDLTGIRCDWYPRNIPIHVCIYTYVEHLTGQSLFLDLDFTLGPTSGMPHVLVRRSSLIPKVRVVHGEPPEFCSIRGASHPAKGRALEVVCFDDGTLITLDQRSAMDAGI